ncbi:MAG: hypothetical protein JO019_02790 [Candidatus Kaiserbacteria bacterium]|nr:hypothetical protein [Candidatus Kaiserbacteria bacterium]
METFEHYALQLRSVRPLVYTAMSKHLFYYRMFISKFVLEREAIPLNPFVSCDYFLLDSVDRNVVREGNNNLVKRADELWVFGPVSNGVLAEIHIAKEMGKPVRYFKVEKSSSIVEISKANAELESDVVQFANTL